MSSPTSVPTASRILPACPSAGVCEANGNSVEQGIRRYETPLNGIDGQAELLEDGDSEKDGIVVIPAYNEAARLPRYLRAMVLYFETRGEPFEVIVVDDGSADETSDCVRELAAVHPEVRVVRFPYNVGKATPSSSAC